MTTTMTTSEYSKITGFSMEDAEMIMSTTNDNDRQHALIVAISHLDCFAAKVAMTVLSTGRISVKQADILTREALEEIYITNDAVWAINNAIDEKNRLFKNAQ